MPEEENVEMEEEEEEEVAAEEPKTGFFSNIKAKLTKILGLLVGAILVILISVGAAYWVSSKIGKKAQLREIGGKLVVPPPAPDADFPLGEFTVNIPGDDDEPHFIRADITLGIPERNMQLSAELGKRRTQILHIINMVLSEKQLKEVNTKEGKNNLIVEIKELINQTLQEGKVNNVYFKKLTVM